MATKRTTRPNQPAVSINGKEVKPLVSPTTAQTVKTQVHKANKAKEEYLVEHPPVSMEKAGDISAQKMGCTTDAVSEIVNQKMKWFFEGKRRGRCKTDDEVWERICEFWTTIQATGEIPYKTDLYAFLDIGRDLACRWLSGQGCSRTRTEMLNTFNMMYDSVRDDLASKGLIDRIAYIWQSKQWQGYTEPKQIMEFRTESALQSLPDTNALSAKYLNAIPYEEVQALDAPDEEKK